MVRWLLAGSLLAVMGAGQANAGDKSPAPAAPSRIIQALRAQPAAPGTGDEKRSTTEAQPKADPAKEDDKDEAAESEEEAAETPTWTINATADAYFTHNFNDPFTDRNAFRVFDIYDDRGPHFGYGEISIQRKRTPFGFRLDVGGGKTAELVNYAERILSDDDLAEHVQQAYVSANLDKSGKRYLDFGKWVTPAGAEVIEARDNWNYSRSFLFGYAIPFYHTGGRVYNYFNDTDYAMFHVTRGWDVSTDDNGELSYGATGFIQVSPKLGVILNYMVGDEADLVGFDGDTRHLLDLVATYVISPKWSVVVNADYATQDNFRFAPDDVRNVGWKGVAGYLRRTIDANQAVTFRSEIFDDEDGARTGVEQALKEVTLTYERRLHKYLITKLEYRHDWSDQLVFPTRDEGRLVKSQNTVGVAAILSY